MTEVWFAFLRGINLGKRQIKMAELRACLEEAGLSEVKTVIASGNVRFCGESNAKAVANTVQKTIEARFGFAVGVVLRSEAELAAMVAKHPFDTLDPNADLTRHVLMFDQPLPDGLVLKDLRGNTEIVGIEDREIYVAAYRQPNGRYTENVEDVLKPLYAKLDKGVLDTMRNWNTIVKMRV